jgi:hypothetical protein
VRGRRLERREETLALRLFCRVLLNEELFRELRHCLNPVRKSRWLYELRLNIWLRS